MQILPGDEVDTGTKLSFRISTERPGYLVLVDVDASGKLSQIYPNTLSLAQPEGTKPEANRIAPGKPVTIPSAADAGTYQFVASPPTGTGMFVAILSDKPVQMVDLPDVPAALAGQRSAVDYVRENTQTLRILPTEATGKVTEPKWSFATKFYQIR